jgi:hypothetical protein
LVVPFDSESDQEHLLRGVQENDAGGAAFVVGGRHAAGESFFAMKAMSQLL